MAKSNDNWTYYKGNATTQTGVTFKVGTQSGNVYLTSTATVGGYCGTRVDTIKVKRSLTGTSVVSVPAATCFSRSTAYTFQISPAPSTGVVWTVPAGWTVDPNNLNSPIVTITAGAAALSGTISAVGKDCSGAATALTVYIAPVQPTPITGVACVVRGSSYTFSVPKVYGGIKYNWTFPTGWTFSPADSSTVTATVTATGTTGNVTVSASGGAGCANTASSTFATAVIAPKPGTITRVPSTCINKGMTDTLTFSVNAVSGVTYQWVLPVGWTAAASNVAPYSTYVVYSTGVTTSGQYVKVRAQSTCSGTTYTSAYDSTNVITNGITTALTITKTPLDSDLDGIQDGENLTVNAVSGAKYQWYNASGAISGETSRFLDLLNPGTPSASYFVRVAKGECQSQANSTSNYAYARVANTGASAADLMAQVKVYPVPATDVINIELPMSYETASVNFVDMNGANLLSKNLHGKAPAVNINKLDAGSYYMVFTVDGTSFSKKIVVVK